MEEKPQMTKEEILRLIGPYLDDELGVKDALEVEACLAQHPECRAEYERMAALKRVLRERLGGADTRAPDLLRKRVEKALRAQRRRQRRWLPAALSAAAALALMVGGWTAYQRTMMLPSQLLADTLMIYRVERQNPLDLRSGDVRNVALWLTERFQQNVSPMNLVKGDLVGVRLCPFGGQKGAYLRFRVGGRNAGLFISESKGMPYKLPMVPSIRAHGLEIFETRKDGFHLAFWKTGMWFYALVLEDMHEPDMLPRLILPPAASS
ncbi:MAG: hypothetical protein HYY66_00605 [Candidatus Tectomicrobia bacterium]|nr:hypothetical protein [Candidatus Tectomicrobia bacterium]